MYADDITVWTVHPDLPSRVPPASVNRLPEMVRVCGPHALSREDCCTYSRQRLGPSLPCSIADCSTTERYRHSHCRTPSGSGLRDIGLRVGSSVDTICSTESRTTAPPCSPHLPKVWRGLLDDGPSPSAFCTTAKARVPGTVPARRKGTGTGWRLLTGPPCTLLLASPT